MHSIFYFPVWQIICFRFLRNQEGRSSFFFPDQKAGKKLCFSDFFLQIGRYDFFPEKKTDKKINLLFRIKFFFSTSRGKKQNICS